MPTTQKSPQKHTKATQKVGGSANPKPKKPVTKAMEGGSAAPSKCKTTRGGSGNGMKLPWNSKSITNAENIFKLNKKISNITGDISNIKGDISNIKRDITKLKTTNTDLKVGLNLNNLYIKAILEKYSTEEVNQINKTVTSNIERENKKLEDEFISLGIQ